MCHRNGMAKHPSLRTGQGGLGRTTGFTQKIPGDPYLQMSPVPPPAVPGWGASRSCPAAAWGQQWGAEPSPPPTEQTGAGTAARQGRGTTTPRRPRASLPRSPGLAPATPSGGCSSTTTPSLCGWRGLAGKGGFAWPQTKLTLWDL